MDFIPRVLTVELIRLRGLRVRKPASSETLPKSALRSTPDARSSNYTNPVKAISLNRLDRLRCMPGWRHFVTSCQTERVSPRGAGLHPQALTRAYSLSVEGRLLIDNDTVQNQTRPANRHGPQELNVCWLAESGGHHNSDPVSIKRMVMIHMLVWRTSLRAYHATE